MPGIPAGIAVPAYAGVPVTYPGGGDTITLVRGFEDESRTPPDVDWAAWCGSRARWCATRGRSSCRSSSRRCVGNGWPADGRAVAVYNGTLPTPGDVDGHARRAAGTAAGTPRREPAILIVGRVAGLREHLRWFDARPLFGTRVLVTRPREQATELVDLLAAARRRPGGGADDPDRRRPRTGPLLSRAARRGRHVRLGGLHQRERAWKR